MTHEDIWRALDALAAEHGLSASGLARKAGLDATAFNPSKRVGADGRARWPSTESVAKVLAATGAGFSEFAALVTGAAALPRSGRMAMGRRIPLIGLDDLIETKRTGRLQDAADIEALEEIRRLRS